MAVGLAAICACALGGLYWYRSRMEWTPENMASYLPRVNTTIAYLDLEKLREAGLFDLIAGSKAIEELDYRQFVDATGFEYRTDLDRVAIAFQGENRFVMARGKFDWRKINQYLLNLGGTCHNSVCNYQNAQVLGHAVSYMPIRPTVIGLYSGATELGVYDLSPRQKGERAVELPDAPVWVSVPASAWSATRELPGVAKAFAAVFAEAERVVFSVNGVSAVELNLRADVSCPNPVAAEKLHARLGEATAALRKILADEHSAGDGKDLRSLLAGGMFRIDGATVRAVWPIDRALIEALVSGSVK